MKFKNYRPFKHWKAGDYIIGKLISKKKDIHGKPTPKFRLSEMKFGNKKSKNLRRHFTLPPIGLVSFHTELTKVGALVQVTYEGSETITSGKFKGYDVHKVKFEILEREGK